MKKCLTITFFIFILIYARTRDARYQGLMHSISKHDINQVVLKFSNFGNLVYYGSDYGCIWPKGSGHNYIFGAGLCFGTVAPITNDTMVTVGYDLVGGGFSEFGPGLKGMDWYDPNAVIYMYPQLWPPPKDIFPMSLQDTVSEQDSWCCFNDCDKSLHKPNDTEPIGLEVYQSIYVWNYSIIQDVVFVTYNIKNVSENDLSSCYYGLAVDGDIGYWANDYTTCIVDRDYSSPAISCHVDNLAYQWSDTEAVWVEFPGAIGFDLLQTPWDLVPGADKDNDSIPDQYERDSVWYVTNLPASKWDVDGDRLMDWRDPSQIPQIGMSAYKVCNQFGADPSTDIERYLTLAGYNFKTGEYIPYDTLIGLTADDKRFYASSGPFALMKDSSVTLVCAIMFTFWHDEFQSPDTALAKIDETVQSIFNMNWLLPAPPPSPSLTCVPGDHKITLVWDRMPESYADPFYNVVHYAPPSSPVYDSFYLKYDFEGYRIWKSYSGLDGTWRLIDHCDVFNDVVFQDTAQPDSIRLIADNRGLFHSFIDEDVRNGFAYYYALTSFDWNRVRETDTTWRPVWFESGRRSVSGVPRREPANYIPGSFMIESESGNPAIAVNNIEAKITYPLHMTADPMYVEFGSYELDTVKRFDPVYTAYLDDNNGEHVDSFKAVLAFDTSVTITEVPYEFKEFQGLSVTSIFKRYDIPGNVSIFDTVIVGGSYPDSLVFPWIIAMNWAYRGNDFKLTWIKAHGSDSVNSVTVVDLMTGDTIPYKRGDADTLADGWCFQTTWAATDDLDTLVYDPPGGLPTGTRDIYICSGMVLLKRGPDLKQGDPRPGEGDVWTVRADPAYLPAPINARLKITPIPAVVMTDSIFKLNVKVVPNPYIIANEWQQSFRHRKVRFINLPSSCTIRIFNLNGELVKTITHSNNTTDAGTDLTNFNGGDEWWDILSDSRNEVASGVYIFHVQSEVGEQTGKFVIVR